MRGADLFEVLEMSPTQDAGALKRGYFQALERHPPHVDPEGFRRVRQAYEDLSRPGGLMAAYLSRKVDVPLEMSAHERRHAELLRRLVPQVEAARRGRFSEQLLGLGYAEAVARFSG